jgi:hypothetical protein
LTIANVLQIQFMDTLSQVHILTLRILKEYFPADLPVLEASGESYTRSLRDSEHDTTIRPNTGEFGFGATEALALTASIAAIVKSIFDILKTTLEIDKLKATAPEKLAEEWKVALMKHGIHETTAKIIATQFVRDLPQ